VDDLARINHFGNGEPIGASRAEVKKCAGGWPAFMRRMRAILEKE
jgi:hypothetical protein